MIQPFQVSRMSTQIQCARCGNPAGKHCKGCFQAVDVQGRQISPTYYCSKECQRSDWKHRGHKLVCMQACDRKRLHRAGELIQAVFHEYGHACTESWITDVVTGFDGKKTCVVTTYKLGSLLFCDFPDHLFRNEHDRKVMLARFQCDEALLRMHSLILQALEGLDDRMEDLAVSPRRKKEHLDYVAPSGQLDTQHVDGHVFQRLTIAGQQYAFDLTSAQYGHFRTVTPYEEHAERIVQRVTYVDHFGSLEAAGRESKNADIAMALAGDPDAVHA